MSKKLKSVKVSLKIPLIGGIEGTWEPDEHERDAAWEMYVELVTRISVAELKSGEGLLRESLTSLHNLFSITRDILRRYGPSVAQPKDGGDISFGYLAVSILNAEFRPFLSKWHPMLLDYENKKHRDASPVEHETTWNKNEEMRVELNQVRGVLTEYANILAQVAGVPSLIKD